MNKEIDDLTDFSLVEALCNLLPATLPAAPEGGSMHATDPGLRRRRRPSVGVGDANKGQVNIGDARGKSVLMFLACQ